jgi:phosphoglucomutase
MNVEQLIAGYYTNQPDPTNPQQRVIFGTSGHRGSALNATFNEHHLLAIAQAICNYRKRHGIDGPLFLGADTHALSLPALRTVLEVMAANEVDIMLSTNDEYTPTPAISHAILQCNKARSTKFSDGIVITPSHNPPRDGGIKYNPPHGGPASSDVTILIEAEANQLLESNLNGLLRMPYSQALVAQTTHRYDYLRNYIEDLGNVIDMQAIQNSKVRIGVDPLGGAGVHYWPAIAELYDLDLTVINDVIDPTFSFMPPDWDGSIRMDPSSIQAMGNLIKSKDRFDIVFACDPDHDRHGIVCPISGLLPANHYQAAALHYLLENRPLWPSTSAIGKSVVGTQMINRVAAKFSRSIYEVPVGFKWYAEGLSDGTLCFASEESAGAAFARRDGTVWTTDKDGMTAGLLAAEMIATTGKDPAQQYASLETEFGCYFSTRIDAPATPQLKKSLANLSPTQVAHTEIAGDPIINVQTSASGNGTTISGIKITTKQGWFAARPSGTEPIYKIYAESFHSEAHLKKLLSEAQLLINQQLNSERK